MKTRINFTVFVEIILYSIFLNTLKLISGHLDIDSSALIKSGYINVDNG